MGIQPATRRPVGFGGGPARAVGRRYFSLLWEQKSHTLMKHYICKTPNQVTPNQDYVWGETLSPGENKYTLFVTLLRQKDKLDNEVGRAHI